MSHPAKPEPMPTGNGTVILPLVVQDLISRSEVGLIKYQTLLKTHNGRDVLMDAYQEALDLVMYLRQEIEQRNEKESKQ